MEEAWMRDRALLRDLLQKTPQASPRELAQATGRSISWVKKWRKRLVEGDPRDLTLWCSGSRAHHAPYFRWDVQVSRRIVEMRLSPPENLKRVPGPRALLYSLPRDPQGPRSTSSTAPLQSNEMARSCTSRVAWWPVLKSRFTPTSCESRWKKSRWISKMLVLFRLNKARKASGSM